jgi:hypothetical protein
MHVGRAALLLSVGLSRLIDMVRGRGQRSSLEKETRRLRAGKGRKRRKGTPGPIWLVCPSSQTQNWRVARSARSCWGW